MGTELTYLHYVNCPSCHTLFKPRVIPRKLTDNIRCVVCDNIFILGQSTVYNQYNSRINAAKRKSQSKISIRKFIAKNIINTETFLRKHNSQTRAAVITWISIPLVFIIFGFTNLYNNKDQYAQSESYRPYITKFCSVFGCDLPDYSNLNYLTVEDNAIVSVPDQDRVIQLFAMISNRGQYDQKYPNLLVKFTDSNGKTVIQRRITPKQYIKNYNSDKMKLSKNSREYIAMQMRDPGVDAINYEIVLN